MEEQRRRTDDVIEVVIRHGACLDLDVQVERTVLRLWAVGVEVEVGAIAQNSIVTRVGGENARARVDLYNTCQRWRK